MAVIARPLWRPWRSRRTAVRCCMDCFAPHSNDGAKHAYGAQLPAWCSQDRLGGTYPALLCRLESQRGNKIEWLPGPGCFTARKRSHEFLGRTYSPDNGLHNVLPVRAAMQRTGRSWVSKQYVADVCGHGSYPCRPMVAVDQGSMEGQANQPIGHVLSA